MKLQDIQASLEMFIDPLIHYFLFQSALLASSLQHPGTPRIKCEYIVCTLVMSASSVRLVDQSIKQAKYKNNMSKTRWYFLSNNYRKPIIVNIPFRSDDVSPLEKPARSPALPLSIYSERRLLHPDSIAFRISNSAFLSLEAPLISTKSLF